MSKPDINDLMYRYFGGGTDAQYDFYAEAADRGITARDVLSGGASGTPVERFDRDRQSITVFDDFLTDPVERGTFAVVSSVGEAAAVIQEGAPSGLLDLTLGADSTYLHNISLRGQAWESGFTIQAPTLVEWCARIPATGGSDFSARMGVDTAGGLNNFIGFDYRSESTDGINLIAGANFNERIQGQFWSSPSSKSYHRFQIFFDPVAPRVEFAIDGELVGEHTEPNLFGSGGALAKRYQPLVSMLRHTERIAAAKELTVDYSLVIIEAAR